MKNLIFIFIVPLALTAYAPLAPKGRALVTGTFSIFDTTQFYDKEGDKLKSYNTFQRDLYSLDIEGGVTETDTITAHIATTETRDHLNGNEYDLADPEFSWKRGWLFWERAIFSTEITAITPFEGSYIADIRYGRYGLQGALLYAETFFPFGYKTTLDGSLAYRWYSGFASDQMRSTLSAWIDLSCQFQLLVESAIEYGLFNGDEPFNPSFFFYNPHYRVWKGRVELNYYISDRFSLTGGYMYHFMGQNIAAGGEWLIRSTYCF